MKKYVAIGHWDNSENITCVISEADTIKDFRSDLRGNAFVTFVILSEQKLAEIKSADGFFEVFQIIKKLTGNARRWSEIVDYLDQCWDIIESKLEAI